MRVKTGLVRRARLWAALLATCLQLLATASPADWKVVQESTGNEGATRDVAVSENETRHRLEVRVDSDGTVLASFVLPPGLTRFPEGYCPTFQVDSRRPVNLATWPGGCQVFAQQVQFALGMVRDKRVASPVLIQLMNGIVAAVRYRQEYAGYGEATFSLQGSKQALTAAMGRNVTVTAR